MFDKNKVKVTPARFVEHKNFSDLVGIRGHQNYYVNLLSGKITYKHGKAKIATGHNTITKAKDFVLDTLRASDQGTTVEVAQRFRQGITHPLVETIWSEMIEAKEIDRAENTKKNYRKAWEHGLKPFWKNKTTADINGQNILDYKKWYLKARPTKYAGHTVIYLKMLFGYMVRKKYLSEMPDTSDLDSLPGTVEANAKRKEAGRALSVEERPLLLKGIEGYLKKSQGWVVSRKYKLMLHARIQLAVLLGLMCGLRKTEICILEWKNIDFEKNSFKAWSLKNLKWRDVPMPKAVFSAFKEQQKFTGQGRLVFPMPSNPERHLSSQIIDKLWIQVKAHSGIAGRLRFHDLRVTCATVMGEQGWPPALACKVLDMSLKTYLKHYFKPSGPSKEDWMNKTWK